MSKLKVFILIAGLILLSHTVMAGEYSFGIVPQQATSKLVKNWLPIFKYIEAKTGVKLNFATGKNIPAFEKYCSEQKFDFVYMNPYHYVIFSKQAGYQAFAKAKDKKLKGSWL